MRYAMVGRVASSMSGGPVIVMLGHVTGPSDGAVGVGRVGIVMSHHQNSLKKS